jgi:hypothetical protein
VTLGGRITRIQIDPVEFEMGSAAVKTKGKKQLNDLADLLREKPGLDLQIHARASVQETDALKLQRFRQQIRSSGEAYETAVKRLYKLATRNLKNPPAPASLKQMEAYLAKNWRLPEGALQELAAQRAATIEEKLSQSGIERGRLYVSSDVSENKSARAEFDFLS